MVVLFAVKRTEREPPPSGTSALIGDFWQIALSKSSGSGVLEFRASYLVPTTRTVSWLLIVSTYYPKENVDGDM